VISCVVLIPRAAFGQGELRTSAACVTGAMAVALALAWMAVRDAAGAFVSWLTFVRVAIVLLALSAAGSHVPIMGRALAPLASIGVVLGYFGVLFVIGELRDADVRAFAALLRKPR
jgi:hypothetical protein